MTKMPWQCLLAAVIVILPQLFPVSCEVVTGCDGHLCTTGSPSKFLFAEEERAVLHARCYAACLNEVATTFQEQRARASNVAWPTIPLKEELDGNCIEFRKLMECQRGCVIRQGNQPKPSKKKCRDTCKAECISDCPGNPNTICYYNSTRCPYSCGPRDGCQLGCNDISLGDITTPPEATNPASPLTLVPEDALPRPPGRYTVGRYQVPTHTGSQGSAPLSGLLVKVETNATAYFLFQASLFDEMLDLSYFACQSVSVSFAVVTATSISQFSPTRETCVHGATRYPGQVDRSMINYSVFVDNRGGFENNAVVNISWERPAESHLITHYYLEVFPTEERCTSSDKETEQYNQIGGRASYFVVRAFAPARLPKITCAYQFSLQALPNNTNDIATGFIDIRDPAVVIPSITLECDTEVNETTGLISAESRWYIPRHEEYSTVANAIDFYTVNYTWVEASTGLPLLEVTSKNVFPNQDGSGSNSEGNLTPIQFDVKLRVSVFPRQFFNASFQHLPTPQECLLDISSRAPEPVDRSAITIHDFTIQFNEITSQIRMNLSWEEPKQSYGLIENYQIRLLKNAPTSSGEVRSSDVVFRTNEDAVIMPGMVIIEDVYIETDILCLYLQVRAKNKYNTDWSSWSDSVPLLVDPAGTCEGVSASLVGIRGGVKPLLPIEAWIGVVIGGIAVATLCVFCVCVCICICKRHRMKRRMKRAFMGSGGYPNPMFVAGGRALQRRNSSMRAPLSLTHSSVELDEWEIPVGSVIVDTKFGEGCFGEVHKGVVRGPLPSTRTMKSNICVNVAIKMLKSSATGSERTDFLHEIDTMKKIAEGNNPHVITFVGCVTVQEPLCLITEFVKYGDLLSYLETIRNLVMQKNRQRKLARIAGLREPEPYLEPRKQSCTEPAAAALVLRSHDDGAVGRGVGEEEVDLMSVVPSPDSPYADLGGVEPETLISFAYQIASGMEYLSSLDIVHRDLACRNILIGENKNLKISDFGMSRVVSGDEIYVKTSKGRLPWKWMAIESIVNREFTHASDVWSYGVTLWEIATLGGFPYPMISNAELLDHLKRGYRLECPDNCSSEIYKVMLECWNENPSERKSFPELRSLFDAMLAKNNPYIQFENINSHKAYYNATQSQRSSRIEDDNVIGLTSESEIDFEASSQSTVTLNGASANGAYDYLRPLVPNVEVPPAVDEHGQALHVHNPYVETPTFKFLMNQENLEMSNFELELERIQQSDEMESSTEVQVEINTSANSAIVVE